MDKKSDKKDISKKNCVTYGFWVMIALFVIMIAISYFRWKLPSLIAGILFVISVFFVFIASIITIAPEGKAMAYTAIAITTIFILYILLSATVSVSSGVLG